MARFSSHYVVTFGSVLFVMLIFFAQNDDLHIRASSPTGMIVAPQIERPDTYAYNLNHWMQDFFHVDHAVFPECACADVAKELGRKLDSQPLMVTEDFTTYGPQRVSSVVFGIEQEFAGVLEMVHGKDLVDKPGQDSVINMLVETAVRLPRLERASGVEITLYGVTADLFYVNMGAVKTPMLECNFVRTNYDKCTCQCKTGRTHEYINE